MPMSARSRRTFQQLVTLPEGAIPLAEAALLMACEEYPHLEVSPYLDRLDEIADAARPHIAQGAPAKDNAAAINSVLFDQSAVYIEVARRLNFPVAGVGLPGHFIVKYRYGQEEFFLDPFEGGAFLSIDDCRARFASIYGEEAEFSDRFLSRASHRQILSRMLNNLKRIYLDAQAFDKGHAIVDMMIMVEPDEVHHYRDRGLLRIQLKQFESAAKDLEHYVKLAGESEDRSQIEEQLKELRRIRAMMN